jgi:hypothetical protein
MVLAQTSPPLEDMDNTEKARGRLYWVEESEKRDMVLQSKSK